MKRALIFPLLAAAAAMAPLGIVLGQPAPTVAADLLIVGGSESACAAAVQAARLGVKRVVLVNDIEWLGGQFSSEGVGCVDEWTTVNGKRTHFPRSGIFLEVLERIHRHNRERYGKANPGNAYCGTETIEPAAAERIFEDLLQPYVKSGSVRIERGWEPIRVSVENRRVRGVEFARGAERMTVDAAVTLDSSDWGDVIRLSSARYGAGPDLRSRFGEPSAPESFDEAGAQEMNPLTWCLVLRETGGRAAIIPPPATYDPRTYAALDRTPPWVESDMSEGIYAQSGWSIYTHRRLVDRRHNGFPDGAEATLLNWPVQDYPLCQYPQRVVDALERAAPGSSRRNLVHLPPALRKIVFADVKQHALGMLHHLQTRVHDRVCDFPQSFRYMELTREFKTADHLPPKPYVREGLRLEAMHMTREQDIRAATREPRWARSMPADSVFGFQFNIDFHPTRRKFLTDDRNGPWQYLHTPQRNWHTDTDRAVFPLRGLIPSEVDGLIGGGKNVGVSSVVQSALRLHGQTMHIGQAGGTLAWLALRDRVEPRAVAAAPHRWREVQQRLVRGAGGPGTLLWPWHDVPPGAPHFEAANLLAVRGIWEPEADSLFFQPERTVTRRELARAVERLAGMRPEAGRIRSSPTAEFTDVPLGDPDRDAIESMISRGNFGPRETEFHPNLPCNHATLDRWLRALGLPGERPESDRPTAPLTRAGAVQRLHATLQALALP